MLQVKSEGSMLKNSVLLGEVSLLLYLTLQLIKARLHYGEYNVGGPY